MRVRNPVAPRRGRVRFATWLLDANREPVYSTDRQPLVSEYHQELLRTLMELREDLQARLAETSRLLKENRDLRDQLRQRTPCGNGSGKSRAAFQSSFGVTSPSSAVAAHD